MTESKKPTASNIKYLLTLLNLDTDGTGVRCVRLADALGISKPSVHNMMNTFIESGYISKASYGRAIFTAEGRKEAERYARYFDAVSALLSDMLPQMSDLPAATYALLATLTDEELNSLAKTAHPHKTAS